MRVAGLGLVCVLLVGCSSSDPKSVEPPCSDCGGAAGTGAGTTAASQGGSASSSTGTHSAEASRGGTSSTLPSTGGNPNFLVADPNGQTARNLQISAGTLFWISGMGQIVKASTSGGTAVNIYTQSTGESGTVEIGAIAVDGSDVYFTSCGKKAAARGVYHLADGSSVPTRLVAGTLPTSIALQGNDLCFDDAGSIRCTKKDGSVATTIASDVYNRQPTLVVKDGYVYFHAAFNYSDPEHVYRARVNDGVLDNAGTAGAAGAPNLGATKAEQISTVPGRAMILLAPTFDDNTLYWGAGDSIYRWSPTGGPAKEVSASAVGTEAMTAPAPHEVLYVTDGFMYWLSVGMMSGSKMFKQAVENGTRTQFMTGGITSIVSDANFLYGLAGKEVRRVSK